MNEEDYVDKALGKDENQETLKELKDKNSETKPKVKPTVKKSGFLENPKALRNARSISLGFIVVLIPLFYFLIKENFNLDNLLSWEFGGIMIFTTVAAFIAVAETRKRAFEDTIDANVDISANEIIVTENGLELSDNTLEAIPILNKYNDRLQNVYNQEKTQKKIDKLNRAIANLRIIINYAKFKLFKVIVFNGLFRRKQRVVRMTSKISKITETPLRDKRFKPYRLERLLSAQSSKRYTRIGDKEITSNPQNVNVKKSMLSTILKGFGMSLGGGAIPLALGANFWTIFAFYAGYLAGMSFTVISQYILTKYKTLTEYRKALDKKMKLQEMLLKEINKPKEVIKPIVPEVKVEPEVEEKEVEEENDIGELVERMIKEQELIEEKEKEDD